MAIATHEHYKGDAKKEVIMSVDPQKVMLPVRFN